MFFYPIGEKYTHQKSKNTPIKTRKLKLCWSLYSHRDVDCCFRMSALIRAYFFTRVLFRTECLVLNNQFIADQFYGDDHFTKHILKLVCEVASSWSRLCFCSKISYPQAGCWVLQEFDSQCSLALNDNQCELTYVFKFCCCNVTITRLYSYID